MKAFIWKLKFAVAMSYRVATSIAISWDMAGANLENLNGDTGYSPYDAVQDEIDAWGD